MRTDKKIKGILFVFIASLLWGSQPILAKLSYLTSDVLHTSGISFIFGTLTAFLYVFVTKKELKINKTQVKSILYVTIVGTLFADVLYFYGFSLTSSLNAVLIGHIQPVFIILITYPILKEEKLTFFDYLGGFLMLLSAVIVSSRTLNNLLSLRLGNFGDLVVLAATVAWASNAVVAKKYLMGLNSGLIVAYRYLIAAVVLIIYLLLFSYFVIDSIYQVFLGISIGVGMICYYEGLKILKAAQVGFIELCAPFSAAIFGWIILDEMFTFMQLLGLFVLVAGVYFISKKE